MHSLIFYFRCMQMKDGPSSGTGLVITSSVSEFVSSSGRACHSSFVVDGDWWSAKYENFGGGCSMLHTQPVLKYAFIIVVFKI